MFNPRLRFIVLTACQQLSLAVRFLVLSLLIQAAIGIVHDHRSYAQSDNKVASAVSYTVVATGLSVPRGLLFTKSGDLYVAEEGSGEIAKIARDDRVIKIAKGLSTPHDITIDAKGNLYVAETTANRVSRISPDGKVTTYITGLASPVDLDFNPQGELLVCELGSGKVVAFKTPKKKRVVASGLKGPHGLAFGKEDVTFVNDAFGDKIVKVHREGRMETVAEVGLPVGLALSKSGDLYVAERKFGRVARIKLDGSRITLIKGLKDPRDPALDEAGNLYVAESGQGRVLKLTGKF